MLQLFARKLSRLQRFSGLERFSKVSTAFCSVNSNVGTHDHIADEWWSDTGAFVPLHTMNRLRVPFIKRSLLENGRAVEHVGQSSRPLLGYSVLDVGCGGGILSEALARLGAQVTGIDIGESSIAVANSHAELDEDVRRNVEYDCTTVEELLSQGRLFDCVVASEVVEHIPVENQQSFIINCCNLAKHSVVVTTVNRTTAAYWVAIVAAENIIGIVPQGTHEYSMLVPPDDLQDMLREGGASMRRLHGMCLNPVTMEWAWTDFTSINYAIQAVKFPAKDSCS